MIKIKLFIFVFLAFVNFSFALEKDRLVSFLKEYDASKEKYSGKVGYAIERDYPDVAEFLVLNGETINEYYTTIQKMEGAPRADIFQQHPLLTAIKKNYISLAVTMVSHDKNMCLATEYKMMSFYNSNNRAWNLYRDIERKHALHVAIEHPNGFPVVEALIYAGADVNMIYQHSKGPLDSYFTSPLTLAIANKRLDIAQFLLDNKANIDFNPFFKAIDDGYIEGVVLLLDNGANSMNSAEILILLDRAIKKGHLDIVDVLFNATLNNLKTS